MKNKKILSTLVLTSVLATGFVQPLSAKANPLDKTAVLADLKKSSGKEFKMSVKNNKQKFLSGKLSKRNSADRNEALKFLDEIKDVLSLKDVNKNFAVESVKKDDLGFTHVVFNQVKNGMDVDKNTVSVHFNKDNVITNVTTDIDENALNSSVSTTKNVSQQKAFQTVKNEYKGKNPDVKFVANKVLDKSGKLLSTYQFSVLYKTPEIGGYYVYVDMNTGKIAQKTNLVKNDGAVTGTGTAANGTKRSLNLYESNSKYYAVDTTKDMKGQIQTYTAENIKSGRQRGTLCTSSTKTINDSAVVSAHAYAGVVFDFYKKMFNRNSIDDKGMSLISTVHSKEDIGNACWVDEANQMFYGDAYGVFNKPLCADLDVVAHEMTHGVTNHTANLAYQNQSGALNESMSDVFGVLIQTWDKYNVQNGGSWQFNDSDWVVGDEVCKTELRSLKDPQKDNQPDNMSGYDNENGNDNGGVHKNSGIPNKAAYLVAKSIGCEKTAKIYYRALTNYFNEGTEFFDAYNGLVQAATDLYGSDSAEVKALTSAYSTVGVIDENGNATNNTNDDPFWGWWF